MANVFYLYSVDKNYFLTEFTDKSLKIFYFIKYKNKISHINICTFYTNFYVKIETYRQNNLK